MSQIRFVTDEDVYGAALAEFTGAKVPETAAKQVEGISLLPLLQDADASWPDRLLVHHVGRWAAGKEAGAKCAIQNARFTLVNNSELYDLAADPGESKNVIADHPEVVTRLRAAYDKWWSDVQPLLVNEDAIGPKINPLKELYWKQFGGGPDEKLLERMDPQRKFNQPAKAKTNADRRKKRQEKKAT